MLFQLRVFYGVCGKNLAVPYMYQKCKGCLFFNPYGDTNVSKIGTITPEETNVLRAHLSLIGKLRCGNFLSRLIMRDTTLATPKIVTSLFGKNGYTGIPLAYPISANSVIIGEIVQSHLLYHRLAAHLDALEQMKRPSIASLYSASLMNHKLHQTYPIIENAHEIILNVLDGFVYVLDGFDVESAHSYIKVYLANVCYESDTGWLFDRHSAGEFLGVEKTQDIRYDMLYKPPVVPDVVVSDSLYLSDCEFSMVTLDLERQDAVRVFVQLQTIYYNAMPNHTKAMQHDFRNAYLVLLDKYNGDIDRADIAICDYQNNAGQEVQSNT